MQIQFKKTLATLYFNDGSQTTIKLGAATITDPSNIIGFGKLGHVHVNNWFSIGLESEPLDARSGADIWRIRLEPGALCP